MYRRKLVEGKGSYSIAKELNDQGIPAADGGLWSDTSVDRILENTTYTGFGIANQLATGLYNVRGTDAKPRAVVRGIEEIANSRSAPKVRRPESDWQRQEHPQLVDYLGQDLNELAVAMHQQVWAKKAAKALVPKVKGKPGGDRHTDSPYVLKGLLRTKEGGYPMTGNAKGPGKYRRRYYGATRGHSAPKTGSSMKRLIPAEPLEQAILSIVKDVLLDSPALKVRIEQHIHQEQEALSCNRQNVDLLIVEQQNLIEQVRDGMKLGPSSRKLMQQDFERWENRLQVLEQQIAAAEETSPSRTVDTAKLTAKAVERLAAMANDMGKMPTAAVRQILASIVSSLTVDLETREVEMELTLAEGISLAAKRELGLVSTKSSTHGNQAQWLRGLKIADIRCESEQTARNKTPCFTCSRKAA